MADELATITGTVFLNGADDPDRVPWPDGLVRAVPVLLDETTAIVDSRTIRSALTNSAGTVTLHLWPGAWRIILPDGEVIDGDGSGVVVEAGESYTLRGLRGYVAPPGVTVNTVRLSSLTATTLEPGEDATVEADGDGLVLGIPRGADGAQTYASLDDVDLTGLADGDAMVWDATSERWVRVSLSSTYATVDDALRPKFRPAEPQIVRRVQACSPGHPWVQSSAATGVASYDLNDTTNYLIGSQSVRITTTTDAIFPVLAATALPPIDATGCDIRVWFWVEDIDTVTSIQVQVSGTSSFTDRHGFQITDTAGLGGVSLEGEWFVATVPWSSGLIGGAGATRNAITAIRILVTRVAGQAVTYRLGAVDFIKQNSAGRWPNGVIMLGFDDNSSTQASLAIPAMDARGIVGTFFPIVSGLGTADSLTLSQLKAYAARGWEVAAHASTGAAHSAGMDTMTQVERLAELRTLKRWLIDNGFPSDVYAYPNGRRTKAAEADVALYFNAGRLAAGNRALNTHPSAPFALPAINGGTQSAQLNGYVDKVKADRGALPVLFHDFNTGSGGTSNVATLASFTAFLDYAMAQGVAFATYGQVIRSAI